MTEKTREIRDAKGRSMEDIRRDFPILHTRAHNKHLVYLDNAATTQKPSSVIGEVEAYYKTTNSNIHRGFHYLAEKATDAYEATRLKAKEFIHAASEKEIIFVRGTTEAINLVAATYGRENIGEGDEIIITHMEHHSNIVPWQMLCQEKKATLKIVPINEKGEINLDEFRALISERTKLVSVVYYSNSLGTINPVKEICSIAHEQDIPVLVDGAQATAHAKIDVQELDCDFYAFSGHKIFGPTGIGILYGKEALLEKMPPWQGGGEMIKTVSFEGTTYAELPHKFEAGTPNIAGGVALKAAFEYIEAVGYDFIHAQEQMLLAYATEQLQQIDGLRIIGTADHKTSVISFVIEGVHALDLGTMLSLEGIAVRTGHHCTQPVMSHFGVPATTRASFSFYNTCEEVDLLKAGIEKVVGILK